MGIITISRGSYQSGREIAERTAQRLRYDCISREVLLKASEDFDIPEVKLTQAIEDAPSFLDRFTRGKEKYIAYIQAALLNHLKRDNVVYHGFACNFFVKDIPQVLKVRIILGLANRVEDVMDRYNVSRKEALRLIKKVDEARKKWSQRLYGYDPSDPSLYDLVLHIEKLTVQDAVNTICQMAELVQFHTTPEFAKTMEDLALAAQVRTFLADVKPYVEVCINNGFVSLKTEAPLAEESELVKRMGEVVKRVPGVTGIKVMTEEHLDDGDVCVSQPRVDPSIERRSAYYNELG
ncbi:MAG: cytidylate kinase-like family protein [Desulfobacteraceae bacterium]|jgi:cytidylate kinase